jgi:hypothetical protein
MLKANDYEDKILTKKRLDEEENGVQKQHENKKWAIFAYSGNEVSSITKIFTKHNIKTAFRAKNTVANF